MGLVQRVLEEEGIATVSISLSKGISEKIRPPRVLYLSYPYGYPFGEPFQEKQQFQIFEDCLVLLETAETPGEILSSSYRWRRTKFE